MFFSFITYFSPLFCFLLFHFSFIGFLLSLLFFILSLCLPILMCLDILLKTLAWRSLTLSLRFSAIASSQQPLHGSCHYLMELLTVPSCYLLPPYAALGKAQAHVISDSVGTINESITYYLYLFLFWYHLYHLL
jgi:hypothetical protein